MCECVCGTNRDECARNDGDDNANDDANNANTTDAAARAAVSDRTNRDVSCEARTRLSVVTPACMLIAGICF